MAAPSALEQYMLELINAERARAGAPPLAFDLRLNEAADGHTAFMIATDTFSHTGAAGSSATDRILAAGYPLTAGSAAGENIAFASTRPPAGFVDEARLLHDNLMASAGHRANLLDAGFRQVGIGFAVGDYQGFEAAFVTQDFARSGAAVFITGVAFYDLDGDAAYDVGEGLGGLTVTAANGFVTVTGTTYASGGYDLAVGPGTYTLTFSGAGYVAVSRQVTVGGASVKQDLVSPEPMGRQIVSDGNDELQAIPGFTEIHAGLGNDSILGSSAHDLLRGDDGDDSIAGGDDFDDLHGNQGNDTVAGGAGGDWVVGGKGDDLLFGDAGDDIVYGNLGNDTCAGGDGDDLVRGGQGDDVLRGGAGDDWLSGDRGDDTITGGAGADTFHSFVGAGLDRVLDFSRAEGDRVLLDPGTQFSAVQVGADVLIDLFGGGRVILVGVSMSTLTEGWIVVA